MASILPNHPSSFLRSKDSGDLNLYDQRTFNRALKKFRQGALKNDDKKRYKKSPYDDVRAKLIEYIELRERLYKRDKCGLSWALLKQKALVFAKQLGHDDNFKAGHPALDQQSFMALAPPTAWQRILLIVA
jgi:hypothetical protein